MKKVKDDLRSPLSGTEYISVPQNAQSEDIMRENKLGSFAELLDELKECQWYWAGISAGTASRLLRRRPPGTFLVRDSRSERSIFSFSYATPSGVYHSRIYRFNGRFCLGGPNALISSPSLREFVCQTVARSSADGGDTNREKIGTSTTAASRRNTEEPPLRILMHPSSAEPTAQLVDIRMPLRRNNFVPTLKGACRLAIRFLDSFWEKLKITEIYLFIRVKRTPSKLGGSIFYHWALGVLFNCFVSDGSRIEELPIPKKLKKYLSASDYLLTFPI